MKKQVSILVFVALVFLIVTGCDDRPQYLSNTEQASSKMQIDESHSASVVHEDESVQIIRSIMKLNYETMTVTDFNAEIQAICADAGTNIFEAISDMYDHFAVYDDAGEFIGTVFTDRDLEAFMDTTLAYSAQEIFDAPFHLFNVAYMTTPDLTAKELYQMKEQMSFDEWSAFFEEHTAEINTFPAFFYSMEVEIADPDTLLVSERDSRINDAQASIVNYYIELDEETVAAETFLDTLALELKAMSEKYSDSHITVECSVQELEYDVG
ncbi:hypothetical protein M2146_002710 [Lachnospiraceae bacterium PF1-22]|uniref:hypothetical protein n=1 Tax=Ohessyouella blattaphilus TaxID=2949333 RepID=UPI003E2D8E28